MKLYSYWRSTTSLRVRAALHLKNIPFETIAVDLLAGEQSSDGFTDVNPSQGVPALVLEDGTTLTQSMAILEYLDTVADPKLVPDDPMLAAHVRAAAHIIALDIHPVNNLKVVGKLAQEYQADKIKWMNDWMHAGFTALQASIEPDGAYCFGEDLTIADLCLVGQMVNARRWGLDLTPFSRLVEIDNHCQTHPAIQAAMPEAQPDATA